MVRTCILALLITASSASAQSTPTAAAHGESPHAIVAIPSEMRWAPAPAILPPGAQIAVIEGNPAEPGEFTMRLSMPAGYRIPPHFHPVTEHVTVIEGTFYVGMGVTADTTKATMLPTGTFAALKEGVRHFAFTRTPTIIQLHGVGPWSLTYVDPADDPRGRPR